MNREFIDTHTESQQGLSFEASSIWQTLSLMADVWQIGTPKSNIASRHSTYDCEDEIPFDSNGEGHSISSSSIFHFLHQSFGFLSPE